MATGEDYPLNVVLRAVDKVTSPVRRINSRLESLTGPVKRINNQFRQWAENNGLGRVSGAIGRVRNRMGNLVRAGGQVAQRLGFIGSIGGAVFGKLVSDTAQQGEMVLKWSNRLGVGTEALQEMLFVGKQFGVQSNAMIDALKEMSMRADEFAETGKGPAADAFRRLGLSPEQIKKTKGDTEALFKTLTNAISQVQGTAAKQRIADELFGGQGGEQLAEMAAKSGGELAKLAERARETGNVMGGDGLKASRAFQRRIGVLGDTLRGVRNKVILPLLPTLTKLVSRLTEFAQSHLDEISAWAQQFAAGLPDRIKAIQQWFGRLVDQLTPVVNAIRWVTDTFGTANTILVTLAAVIGGPLIAAVGSLTTAFVTLGWAIASTPVGWIAAAVVAAVAAIAGAAYLIVKNWGPIKAYFAEVWAGMKMAAAGAWSFLKELLSWSPLGLIMQAFGPVSDVVGAVFRNTVGKAKTQLNFLKDLVGSIFGWIQSKVDSVMGFVSSAIDKVSGVASYIPGIEGPGEDAAAAARQRPRGGGTEAVRRNEEVLTRRQEARLRVSFEDLPSGTRVEEDENTGVPLDLDMGYNMVGD